MLLPILGRTSRGFLGKSCLDVYLCPWRLCCVGPNPSPLSGYFGRGKFLVTDRVRVCAIRDAG